MWQVNTVSQIGGRPEEKRGELGLLPALQSAPTAVLSPSPNACSPGQNALTHRCMHYCGQLSHDAWPAGTEKHSTLPGLIYTTVGICIPDCVISQACCANLSSAKHQMRLVDCVPQQGCCVTTVQVPAELWKFPDRVGTVTGESINSYLSNKTDVEDGAIHLMFSANRWEKR